MLDTLRIFKAGIFKALAHPTRVAMVEYLRFGEVSETRLREKVGVEPAAFAQHMDILLRKRIVQTSDDSTHTASTTRLTAASGTLMSRCRRSQSKTRCMATRTSGTAKESSGCDSLHVRSERWC